VSSNDPSDVPRTDPLAATPDRVRRRNAVVGVVCGLGFLTMIGAAYAAVPIYRAFCQLTGFDGATKRAEVNDNRVLDQRITVRFDANLQGLPIAFTAETKRQDVRIGETKLAFFKVVNHSDKPLKARAVYNVVPEQAGPYFEKLQCFCFDEQIIPAKATIEMPVLYFIHPKYAEDINTKGKPEVTLSYTFYPAVESRAEAKPEPKASGG